MHAGSSTPEGRAAKNARLSTVERWIRGWMTQSLQEVRWV